METIFKKTVAKFWLFKISLIYINTALINASKQLKGLVWFINSFLLHSILHYLINSIPVDKGATKGQRHGYKITSNPGTKKQKCIHQAMSVK